MATNFLSKLYSQQSTAEEIAASKEELRFQRIVKQNEYIQKLHKVSTSSQFFAPESRYIGPQDVAGSLDDEGWLNFLEKQQVTKTAKSSGAATSSNLLPSSNFSFLKRNWGKVALGGIGALWLTNKVASSFSTDKYYGLSKDQQEIAEIETLGPKYSRLRQRLQSELATDEGPAEASRRFNLLKLGLEKYGEKVGTGHKRLLIPNSEMLSKKDIEEELGFVPVKIAIPEAGQTTFTSWRHPDNLYHLHQHKSYWTLHRDEHAASTMLSKKRLMSPDASENPLSTAAGVVGDFVTGIPHVVTEGIPGLFYYLKGQLTNTPGMEQRLLEETSSEYNRVLAFSTGRYHGGGVKGLAPNQTEENAGVNGFDGMSHGGIAADLRKQNTPFGSKYDRARALAKMMDSTFESLTRSNEFRESLFQANVVKELGKGRFGQADLMETTFQGEKFQFVRKTIQKGAREQLMKEAVHPEKYLQSFNLAREASIMKPLGMTEAVPSVYHSTEKELFMELMPGEELFRFMGKGGQLPEDAIRRMQSTIEQASREGITNLDIHQGNVMFDPETQRISWIDWGQAQQSTSGISTDEMLAKFKTASTPESAFQAAQTAPAKKRKKRKQIEELPSRAQQTVVNKKKNTAARITNNIRKKQTDNIHAGGRFDGMQHGGMGASKRNQTTDFGSPWKGLFGGLSRKVKKFLGKEVSKDSQKLLDPRKAAKMAQGKSLEEFAQQLGGDIRILGRTKYTGSQEDIIKKKVFEETAIGQGAGAGFIPGDMIYVHPETAKARALAKAKQIGIDDDISKQVVESEDFLKTLLYHEYLEKQALERFGGTMKMVGPGAKHQAGQVIFGEAGFVSQLKDNNLKSFFSKLRSTKTEHSTFEAGLEAFSKDGVAAELRPLLTDFASPWRGLLDSTSVKVARQAASQTSRASSKLTESAQDLRIAQEDIWNWANNAGKNHSGYAGKHVKQLSRFGGNL